MAAAQSLDINLFWFQAHATGVVAICSVVIIALAFIAFLALRWR